MKNALMVTLAVCSSSCASTILLRGSSSDFLNAKGTTVTVNAPPSAIQPVLTDLFSQRGFGPAGTKIGNQNAEIIFFKGPRQVPAEAAAYGVQVGSWFAARVLAQGSQTVVTLFGKPTIGGVEVCSDADNALTDIAYQCTDTRMPSGWMGANLVSGRDEEEVVSWVLNGVYEQLK